MSRSDPPGGNLPPATATLHGQQLDLLALATEVSDRFFAEFPGDYELYGDVGVQWCRHDNQWVLLWAAYDLSGAADLGEQVQWLARVLAARDYPLGRLVRSLEIAADVAEEAVPDQGPDMSARLRRAAAAIPAPPG